MEKIYHANGTKKSSCGYFNIKVEFKTRSITKEKDTHFIKIKGPRRQKKILNVYASNNKALKYISKNFQN